MIINTNIEAMKTLRSLNVNNRQNEKTMEKLASGMKINRAADDAAGLAISVKMRAQIRGLLQDDRNIADGISMFNVAEGGMAQIEDMIHRIRELAVQSANDTNTDSDRAKMQLEVEQLIEGIDRIAIDTEFNTHKVLQGTAGTTTIAVYRSNQALAAAASTLQAVTFRNDGTQMTTQFTINGIQISLGPLHASYPAVNGLDSYLLAAYTNLYGTSHGSDFEDFLKNNMYGPSNTVSAQNAQVFINTIAAAMNSAINDYNTINPGSTLSATITGVYFDDPTDAANYGRVGLYMPDGGTIGWGGCSGTYTTYSNIGHHYLHSSFSGGGIASINTPTIDPQKYIIQVGANTDQNIKFEIPPMPASVLGNVGPPPKVIADASIITQFQANSTIELCDIALDYVSDARAKMGAHVNRLEHSGVNAAVYQENISAAESRLRDTKMSKEMIDQVKGIILSQAATAMLSQANQRPESIMQLLR